MIDVYRQGRNGNLLEDDGPVLVCEFGERVVEAVFRNQPLEYRYMNMRNRGLKGFAPQDKFWIMPVTAEEVAAGLKRDVGVYTDPGGDIFLNLSRRAGFGLDPGDHWPTFELIDICDQPEVLLERGIERLILPGLPYIEQERVSIEVWGKPDPAKQFSED